MPKEGMPIRRRLVRLSVALALCGPASHPVSAAPSSGADPASLKEPLPNAVWLEDLDFSQHADRLTPRRSSKGTPLQVASQIYPHGLGGTGRAQLLIDLGAHARRLVMSVGIDDIEKSNGSKEFQVWLDDRLVTTSGVLRKGEIKPMDVDVTGARVLEIIVAHGGVESDWDRFVLGGAQLVLDGAVKDRGAWPRPFKLSPEPALPIASRKHDVVSINGPRIVGGTPGRPFQHRLSISGSGAGGLKISVSGLPKGIVFEPETRTLRGSLPSVGRFPLKILAKDRRAEARATLVLVGSLAAKAKAMTPIMGWNSWNIYGKSIDASKIRKAAEALVTSGLAEHGYTYVNIDDGWEGARDSKGHLQASAAFGDVPSLADHLHKQGLKLGIYSSPGPKTCADFEGSYGHEAADAESFAAWGIDLLKYDWCSYDKIAPNLSPAEQRRPYALMQTALNETARDIVYSVCSYGRGEVWTWARGVGASQWRTTSDITDSWSSLEGIAFSQSDKATFAGPGHVNDPDMLVVGKVGWGEHIRQTNLSANEQILHMTHWAMLAAPLLLGCDLTALDEFTLDLLSNDEVLAVDQDEKVIPAERKHVDGRSEIWTRPLSDGSVAVAVYYRGPKGRAVDVRFADLGLPQIQAVRDLWQRRDLGKFTDSLQVSVPQHGAIMLKMAAPPAKKP